MTRKEECRLRKVVLHVGSEKTGSTSIQYCLSRSRDLLLRHGVLYPPGDTGKDHQEVFGSCFAEESDLLSYNHHRSEFRALLERDREYFRSLKTLLGKTDATTLVFSYEGFSHLTQNAFNEMKQFLEGYCDDIRVIFYVRPPLSYAASAMSQRVKMGLRACADGENIPSVKYQDILEKLCSTFEKSRVDVRLFSSEAFPEGNVVRDFLSLLDLPSQVQEDIIRKGRNKNYSLSQEAMAIGNRMAEVLDGYLPTFDFNTKRSIGSVFLPAIKGQTFQLTAMQKKTVLSHAAPDLEYLSREFDITMQERLHSDCKPLSISQATVDCTARMLLRLLVPDFDQPLEAPAPNRGTLDRCFVLRVMLKAGIIAIALPVYRSLRSMWCRLTRKPGP